ncbi:MAG TPA: tyrosine-type recombinase/integrase [Candidatus Acidoferrales bacterium]|nr:tyrosine-type recombinase/integrase [Candidatus Acidoferrales bacterium]
MKPELIQQARRHSYHIAEGFFSESPQAKSWEVAFQRAIETMPPATQATFQEMVEDLARSAGVDPEVACSTLLNDWARKWLDDSRRNAESKKLGEAVEDLLRAKTLANRRPSYVKSLKQYLGQFVRGREDMPLRDVRLEDIEKWFLGRNEATCTRASNTWRLSALFSFAVRRGWIQDNPCRRLEGVRVDRDVPVIFTVKQCRAMLEFAREHFPRFIPWMALALFAGVRPDELRRLTWACVDLKAQHVVIDQAASKVRRRRITPLDEAAVRWLRLGGDLPIAHVMKRRYIRRLRDHLGLAKWPPDGLRHTAASMMLAKTDNATLVSRWLGNSSRILLDHYIELVKKEDVASFWEL